jgi:hypothetical protein
MFEIKIRKPNSYYQVDIQIDNNKIDYGLLNTSEATQLAVTLLSATESLLSGDEQNKLNEIIENLN